MHRLRALTGDASPAALVLACAVPFVFLHPHYQPHAAFGRVDVDLSDLAILAAALAALWDGFRRGWEPLRAGRTIWPWAAAFLILLLLSLYLIKAIRAGTVVVPSIRVAPAILVYRCLAAFSAAISP